MPSPYSILCASLCAAGAFLIALPAGSADRAKLSEAQKQERAACMAQSQEDHAACLREAAAARQAARRGELDEGQGAEYEKNKLARCNALPQADREDCIQLNRGAGTTTESGIRQLVTPLPAGERDSAGGRSGR